VLRAFFGQGGDGKEEGGGDGEDDDDDDDEAALSVAVRAVVPAPREPALVLAAWDASAGMVEEGEVVAAGTETAAAGAAAEEEAGARALAAGVAGLAV
jgi:hypothetical protein